MTRFRTTFTFEYESDDSQGAYGTSDPDEMAAIDSQQFAADPQAWFSLAEICIDEYLDVIVEPLE